MLTAFLTTALYKLALLIYSASGLEGSTSWIRTLGRLPLVLGWDLVAGALVGCLGAWVASAARRSGFPRLGRGLVIGLLALNGAYLAIAFRVATLVGAPPDKATLDLAFFSSESPKGSGLSTSARFGMERAFRQPDRELRGNPRQLATSVAGSPLFVLERHEPMLPFGG